MTVWHGHLQTLYGALGRRVGKVAWRRERLELPDGDFVELDHAGEAADRVLVVHGLGGSSAAPYVRGLALELLGRGWSVTAMNLRGALAPNRLPRTYHAGDTADVLRVAEHLAKDAATLMAVGFSLGGNALIKLMGECGDKAPFRAAASVCAPLDLELTARRLHQGFSRVYEAYLLVGLKRALWRKRAIVRSQVDWSRMWRATSFAEWDGVVTAPLNGFQSAADYWQRSSGRGFVAGIGKPTLILHALNDPFMPPAVLPAEVPSWVTVEAYPWGGHVGFVTGRSAPSFADVRVATYFESQRRMPAA